MPNLVLLSVILATAAADDGWEPLFDGKSLDGWHEIGDASFELVDGVLVGRQTKENKEYGHLVTDRTFGDFAVRVRFRTLQGNSGLYFRVVEQGNSGVTGFQAEIDPERRTGGLYETNGRAWVIEPDAAMVERTLKKDDWNTMIVSCVGTRTLVALNGRRTAKLIDEMGRREGRIALQVHGGQDVHVEFGSVDVIVDPARDPLLMAEDDRRLHEVKTLDGEFLFEPPATLEEWKVRREEVRQRILVAAGLVPPLAALPGDFSVHGLIDRGDYTVEKVSFYNRPLYVTGNLYRPKHGTPPFPAVLSPHGHAQGGRFDEKSDAEVQRTLDSGAERDANAARYYIQARMAHLARMGFVVFHYDMIGYADSRQLDHREGFTDVESMMWGESFFGLQTRNTLAAYDFLSSRPDVDPSRIGVTGASGGGTQTFILCAIDDRPAAAFPAVMVSTAMQGGCICENAPHLRVGTGNVEFAALAAPIPYGMSCADDWTIDMEVKGMPALERVWSMFGAADRVVARTWPEHGHNYNVHAREMMYGWFARKLGLGDDAPLVEGAFEPVPPAELSVYDDDHPAPERLDLRSFKRANRELAAWAVTLGLQRPEQLPDVDLIADVLAPALRVLISSGLPVAADVETSLVHEEHGDVGVRREMTIGRRGQGEVVPIRTYRNDQTFNGTAVVIARPGGAFASDVMTLVRGGALVIDVDELLTTVAGKLPVDERRHGWYAGYTYGYNRTLIAQRVHDLLTAIAFARAQPGVERVRLMGMEDAGVWAVLAAGLAGDAVDRVAVDLTWSFGDVDSVDHPGFLPGALRYGGVDGFAALIAPVPVRICDADVPPRTARVYAHRGADVARIDTVGERPSTLLRWLSDVE